MGRMNLFNLIKNVFHFETNLSEKNEGNSH